LIDFAGRWGRDAPLAITNMGDNLVTVSRDDQTFAPVEQRRSTAGVYNTAGDKLELQGQGSAAPRAPSLRPSANEKSLVFFFIVIPTVLALVTNIFARSDAPIIYLVGSIVWIGWLLGLLVLWTYRRQRKTAQRLLNEEALLFTKRGSEFVLYLRSFFTSRHLPIRNSMPSIYDRQLVGRFWDLEFALAYSFDSLYRLVAIGDKKRSYGAGKIQIDDKHWQELFAELAAKAKLIFIVPFATSGTLYEVSWLLARPNLLRKTIVIMPPTYLRLSSLGALLFGRGHLQRWNKARTLLRRNGFEMPPYKRRGALILLDDNGLYCKEFFTDDFSEERLLPFAKSIIAAGQIVSPEEYRKAIANIQISRRGWSYWIAEWGWRRWISYRLTGVPPVVLKSVLLALLIRTFLWQPFNIPSGSNIPTLLVGDYLFASKYSYGYTHYSLPLSLNIFSGRIFGSPPQRGDVVVFRLPRDPSIDYIKRVVGLPGDRIQMIDGVLNINGVPVKREHITRGCVAHEDLGQTVICYRETLQNGVTYITHNFSSNGFLDNTAVYHVPPSDYFLMGDNRDNSVDSRVPSAVGYVPFENLIGKAQIIFFSIGGDTPPMWIWRWPWAVRWSRLFTLVR
jgi:signal peptidase I